MKNSDLITILCQTLAKEIAPLVAEEIIRHERKKEVTGDEQITPSQVREMAHCRNARVQSALDTGVLPSTTAGKGLPGKGPRRLVRRGDARAWIQAGKPAGKPL